MFKVDNVSLLYDLQKEEKTYALSHINLEIKDKKFYGISGPSGSGKSSLLYIMSGIKKPTSGSVYYNDIEITALDDEQASRLRLKKFGFIFQKHFLIPYMNVLENVLVPINSNSKQDIEKAVELLEELDLKKQIYKRPDELSGGQCQRVAIVRALINNPEVIFADEITASLDKENALKVIEILKRAGNLATILFVTHDMRMLQEADEIIDLWDGKLGGRPNE